MACKSSFVSAETPNTSIKIVGACFFFMLGCFAFQHIPELGFNKADDDWMLLDNPLTQNFRFSVSYIKEVFSQFNKIQYSPINTLYFATIYEINGFDPYYFHLGSLLLHFINTLLLFFLGKQILVSVFNRTSSADEIILLVCGLWFIAPMNVESVAWVSASKVLLFTLFSILAFLFFIKSWDEERIITLIVSTLFFVIACFCKEQAIVFPLMPLCLLYFAKRKISLRFKKVLFIYFIVSLTIAFIFILITLQANRISLEKMPSSQPFYLRPVYAAYCLFFYVYNFLLPIDIHYHYPFPTNATQNSRFLLYLFPVILIGIALLLWYLMKPFLKDPFFLFCLFCFFINIGLTLQIVPMTRTAIAADRYMYFPSYFLLLFFIVQIGKISLTRSSSKFQVSLLFGLLCYAIFFSIYSSKLVLAWNTHIIR